MANASAVQPIFTPISTSTAAPLFDFSDTPVAQDYAGFYLKVIDDVYTSEECAELIALAESTSVASSISPLSPPSAARSLGGTNTRTYKLGWQQAAVSSGLGKDYIATNYRNSKRILRFDHDAAEKLYERLKPFVEDIECIEPGSEWWHMMGIGRFGSNEKWELVGVNERLSFLKYEPGHYFRAHCDGLPPLPDGRRSFVTLQIYLGDDGVEGGSTRIMGQNGDYIDIEPKKGRVLIFQQRGLVHSGEDIIKGVKYTLRSDFMYRAGV